MRWIVQEIKRVRPLFCWFWVLAALCTACGQPPAKTAKKNALPSEAAAIADDPTLTTLGVPPPVDPTVTFALPIREVGVDAPVILAFSEPMVPLAAVDQPATLTAVTLDSDVALHWRWVSTDTVVGQPDKKWPHGTTFHAHLAAGLRTRAGRLVQQPLDWTFHTAPPLLVWQSPEDGDGFVQRNAEVVLEFNQPVDLAQVREHLAVAADQAGVTLPPFQLLHKVPKSFQGLRSAVPAAFATLKFAQPLPAWQQIKVTLSPGLRGLGGDVTTPFAQILHFGTSGGAEEPSQGALEPFFLVQVENASGDDPASWRVADLKFSTPMAPVDQSKLLTSNPPAYVDMRCEDAECTIGGVFQPMTTYTITVPATLQDAHGRRLGKPIVLTRSFGHRLPTLSIDTDGTVMEFQQKPHAVAVTMRNLTTVTARLWSVPADTPWSVLRDLKVNEPAYAAALAKLGTPVDVPIKSTLTPDEVERRILDLDKLLAGKPGRVWLEVATPDIKPVPGERWSPSGKDGRLFQVTDLHITAKKARNETLFWVTSLQTGQPVPGARVELRDEQDSVLWRSTTNSEGLATGPGGMQWGARKKATERRVTAVKDDDSATLEVVEPVAWAGDGDEDQTDRERGWLFTDKPVYRRGETVQVKGLLRLVGKDALGLPPAGREATVQLLDPFGHIATESVVRLSARGTFATALPFPPSGELGSWMINVQSEHAAFSKYVQLAVYHVPRTKVELALKSRHVARGDAVQGELLAAWFSGGPLEKAPVHVTASGSSQAFAPAGWPTFQFGRTAWSEDDGPGGQNFFNHELRTTTDDRGRAHFAVPTGIAMDRSLHAEVSVSVEDPNGRPMQASQGVWIHPAAAHVGVNLTSALVTAHSPLPVHLIATDVEGHALAGLPLTVKLQRREWKAIRVHGMAGETSWQTRLVVTPAGTCTTRSAELPVDCTLTVQQPGLYALQTSVRDGRGRTATTTTDFYATGPDLVWGPYDDREMLVADKASYKVGDTAHILVRNRVPGALALVTEERVGILRTRLVKLEGAAPTIDIPIEARHAPNVHIGVVAMASRRSDGALGLDTGAPGVQVESIELHVDAADHRLQVTVTPEHKKALPGQKTSVEVAVRDAAGRPRAAEVTLWAVDEGVLALTGEATPDPLETLYAAIERGVEDMVQMDGLVRRRAGELKGDPGGGGGNSSGMTRTNQRDVAFWQAAIELPADGKARHTFTLPDNLSTWRIMAVAVDGPGDFGSGDAQVEVSKPLMVQPALPKSVAIGDEVELTATVRNRQPYAVMTQVELVLTGPLTLNGPGTQPLALAPQQSLEVRFRARATAAGHAKVVWRATAKADQQPNVSDAVEEAIEVKTFSALETVASWSQVTGSRLEVLQKTAEVLPDRGGLRVEVSGSLAVGAQVAIAALADYPYDCTEQLTSRLQGLLAARALGGDDKAALATVAGDPLAMAQQWIDHIAARAGYDGGIALWDHGDPHLDATFWAVWVLADAKVAGLRVDPVLLQRAAKWLRIHESDRVLAFAAEAAVGLADPATAESLFAARAQLDLDDALWLSAALVRLDARKYATHVQTLLDPLLATIRVDGESAFLPPAPSTWSWSSAVHRHAHLVEVLARANPAHPLLPRLTRWLVRQQGGHGWRTTHDDAWALRALVAQTQAGAAPTGDFRFSVGDQQVLAGPVSRSLHVDSATVPQEKLPLGDTRLKFERRGQGPVWLRLAYSYARRTPSEEARNAGLLVRRQLFTLRGVPVTGPLHRGDQVIVQVEVTAGDAWDDVVVVDTPAAGLEPVDLRFANSDAGLVQRLGAVQVDPQAELVIPEHTELAGREVRFFVHLKPGTSVLRYIARAATRGTFFDAGARADAMYRPDVFGTSGAATQRID